MPFDEDFIMGHQVRMPVMADELLALSYGAGQSVDHDKFSLYFHQGRRLAIVSAYNVDGASLLPAGSIKRKSFVYDPSVPKHIQIDNDEGYSNNRWDRGHLARRRALHWGDEATAVLADRQSSYWTNIAPQHENLHDTAWGSIEDWLFELADQGQRRLSVFVGPILMQHDPKLINKPGEREVQIPAGFWKVVALLHKGTLRAAAFVTWQRDHDSATPVSFDPVLEQVRLTTVEYLTSLSFMDLTTADPLRYGATETEGEDFEAETVEASGHASVLGSRSSVTSASSRERNGAVIRSAHDIAL